MNQLKIDTLVVKLKYRLEHLEKLLNEPTTIENKIYYQAQITTIQLILWELEN